MSKEWWLHGCRRAERSYCKFKVRRGGGEEIPLVQVKEQRLHFAGTAVTRYPTSKELWLRGHRRADRSHSMFKVRRGCCEEIPLIQGKAQQLHFAGTAKKRYPKTR